MQRLCLSLARHQVQWPLTMLQEVCVACVAYKHIILTAYWHIIDPPRSLFTRQREDLDYADCIPNMAAAGSPHLPRTHGPSAPALCEQQTD